MRAGFKLGHVEQIGDEPVKPLGFVDDRRQQIGLLAVAELVGEIAQGAGRTEHRSQRRFQIVGDRGQQRRAQPFGLGGAFDAVHVFDQTDALDRQRALVASERRAAGAGRE